MDHEIESLAASGIERASIALTNAFMDDPFQKYVFPDESDRRSKSPAHFAGLLRYGLMFGEVYAAKNGAGAAVWLKPNETDVTPERAEQAGFGSLPDLMGEDASERFFSVIDFTDEFHSTDAADPHWYTMVVGVDPAFQGCGYGKALLQPVLERAGRNGISAYLETTQPKNVTFYEKLGFNVVRELVEPTSGLNVWTFRLDP